MLKSFKSIVVIALCLMVGTIFATDQTPTPTDVQKLATGEQTLKVGHILFPPFDETINGQATGMDIDIMREVAKRANIKKLAFVEFKSIQELMAALDKGEVNLVASGLFISPERKKKYLLTIPYYLGGGMGFLYVNGQHSFKTANDLQGYRIGALQHGYAENSWLPQHGISAQKVTGYPSLQELLQALKNGEIDVVVTNYTVSRYYASKDKQLAAYLVQPLGIAYDMRKQDSALQQSLNQALQSMSDDGSLYTIKLKYLAPIGIQPHKKLSP
jgi:ABC-type amino acid transport substrate-binding protein